MIRVSTKRRGFAAADISCPGLATGRPNEKGILGPLSNVLGGDAGRISGVGGLPATTIEFRAFAGERVETPEAPADRTDAKDQRGGTADRDDETDRTEGNPRDGDGEGLQSLNLVDVGVPQVEVVDRLSPRPPELIEKR